MTITNMTPDRELLEYLHTQFPSTVGHIPLKDKISDVVRHGMTLSAEIAQQTAEVASEITARLTGLSIKVNILSARDNLTKLP